MKSVRKTSSASAVIIALTFLALISICVLGLIEATRMDMASSSSHLESVRAELLAQSAVDRVVGTLRQNTSGTSVYWISQPGQLMVADGSTGRLMASGSIALFSGVGNVAITDARFRTPSLNVPSFQNSSNYTITSLTGSDRSVVNMQVKWLYLRVDGSIDDADQPVTTNTGNPIVGRYAYWTDDESSKINYNIAWGRSIVNQSAPQGNPTKIDLTALPNITGTMAEMLHNFITTDNYNTFNHGCFNTPEDARRVGATGLSAALEANKFAITHYNNSPNTTFFNEPRIVLTTQEKYAPRDFNGNLLRDQNGTPYFLDILSINNSDPGKASSINESKLNATVNMLMRYLQRTDWPMISGTSSFQQKYYGSYPTSNAQSYRLIQLVLNIIDYVRSKESTLDCVEPIRAYGTGGSNLPLKLGNGTDSSSFIGLTRGPCITEIGVSVSASPVVTATATGFQVTHTTEIYLPENYGLSSIDLAKGGYSIVQRFWDLDHNAATVQYNYSISASQVTSATSGKVGAGEYAYVTQTCPNLIPSASRPARLGVRIGIQTSALNDIAPLLGGTADVIVMSVNGGSTEVDDPRVNKNCNDWKQRASGNSFGHINSCSTIGNSPTSGFYGQDLDADGYISKASLYMPPPKGKTYTRPDGVIDDNTLGVVTSIGEIGYIHTGVESAAKAGTPWRTFHLQPNTDSATVVPDWALMDLFTVPSVMLSSGSAVALSSTAKATAILNPNSSSDGGLVNINSHIEPFGFSRITPLVAALQGCRVSSTNSAILSATDASAIAQAIFNRTLALNGKMYACPNAYFSRGEVVEIAGVADRGEDSEEMVREISNLMTTRGNVFTVYSIGQALKQTKDGGLMMRGECRLQVTIERFLYYKSDGTSEVRYRTLYYRPLTP